MGNNPSDPHNHLCSFGFTEKEALSSLAARFAFANIPVYRDDGGELFVLCTHKRKKIFQLEQRNTELEARLIFHAFVSDYHKEVPTI